MLHNMTSQRPYYNTSEIINYVYSDGASVYLRKKCV